MMGLPVDIEPIKIAGGPGTLGIDRTRPQASRSIHPAVIESVARSFL